MPTLSICIPYHAGIQRLRACLRSLTRHPANCPHEVIVVDDASEVPCEEDVRAEFPQVRVVRLEHNTGFAGAINAAYPFTSGELLLILNSDTVVHPGAIDAMIAAIVQRTDRGAVGPLLLNEDGTVQPQCKRGRLSPVNGLAYALGLDRLFPGHPVLDGYLCRLDGYTEERDVEALMGSCMLIRRQALSDVGGLDATMFLYGEDIDLCYRLRAAGWRVTFTPASQVTHVGGAGGTRVRYLRSQYHYHRSLVMLFDKHPPSRRYAAYRWIVVAGLWARFGLMAGAYALGRRRIGSSKRLGPKRPEPASTSIGSGRHASPSWPRR